MRVAGVMSGTSLDGIDVAIVDIAGSGWKTRLQTVAHAVTPYPRRVREALLAMSNATAHTGDVARMSVLLGELYAEAVLRACKQADVAANTLQLVGCHGQTIFHQGQAKPFLGRPIAATLQIGDASPLAERLGVPVVSDFRTRDMAAGGTGAPLVPFLDYAVFRHPRKGRVALNLGGIGNVTALPPGATPEQVIAFDTGPANMVIDQLVAAYTQGRQTHDRGGRLARRGVVNQPLVKRLLRHPYYRTAPPKTAGREQYGEAFTAQLRHNTPRWEDAIATATYFSAATIADALQRFVLPQQPVHELIAAGGGTHNPVLMEHLQTLLPNTLVTTTTTFGIDPDAKEAIAFALLAYESWHKRPGNVPTATGAQRQVVLGKLTQP